LPGFCSLTDNGNGTAGIDCTPGFGDAGSYPVTVTVSDNGSPLQSDSQTFNLIVNGVNRVPLLNGIGNQSVDEDTTLTISLSATDPDGDALAFSATGLPGFCSLTDNGDGTAGIGCSPGPGDAAIYLVTVQVSDDGSPAQSDSRSFNLTVNGANRAPVLAAIGNKTVDEGATLTISLSATDPDGDALAFSATGLPGFCSLTDNNNGSARIVCSPRTGDARTYSTSVTVNDSGTPMLSDGETISIVIRERPITNTSPGGGGGGAIDYWLILMLLLLHRRNGVSRRRQAGNSSNGLI